MSPSRTASSLRLGAAVAGVALLLSACGEDGGEPPAAAVVDGTVVSQESVVAELEAITGNERYREALEASGQEVGDPGAEEFSTAFATQVLGRQIQFTLVENEVERRGVEVDDECRASARDDLVANNLAPAFEGDVATAETVLDEFPEEYRERLIGWNANTLALQGDLLGQPCVVDDPVAAYFEANQDDLDQTCVSHILLDTVEEAEQVLTDLGGGAEFATLATERSTDPGSAAEGGDLGCYTPGELGAFVPEFGAAIPDAELDVPTAPVETEFGAHVILVTERREADLEELRDELPELIAQESQQAFGEFFSTALQEATVTVDERYGTWDPASAAIAPPAAEPPAADAPAGSDDGGADGGATATTGG